MTEDNNKNNDAKNKAVMELLNRPEPFVLPSLEELEKVINLINEDSIDADSLMLQRLTDVKKLEVENEIKKVESMLGVELPEDYKRIQLTYDLGAFMIGANTGFYGVDRLIGETKNWEEITESMEIPSLKNSLLIAIEEFYWHFIDFKTGAVYMCDEENAIDEEAELTSENWYARMADSFELYFRGLLYGDIIGWNVTYRPEGETTEFYISRAEVSIENIWESIKGRDSYKSHWEDIVCLDQITNNDR